MHSLFGSRDYKNYLREAIAARPSAGRGVRAGLARAAGCQTAYVSQVLGGTAHFSLEQAQAISLFLGHAASETHFFLLLVQFARAGTPALRAYFSKQLEQADEARLSLKERLGIEQSLNLEAQATYYSAWYYVAIHVLVSIPGFQSAPPIARQLGLSVQKVGEVLGFLSSVGLVRSEQNRFVTGKSRIHLGHDSPLISKHHINWRMQAMRSLDAAGPGLQDKNLHYSSAVSLSHKDVDVLRTQWIESIEKAKSVVRKSNEETAYCLAIDFFSILGRDQS